MNSEVAGALALFFEGGRGPSHDELNRVFSKSGFEQFDPAREDPAASVGKLKRVRGALLDGSDVHPAAALRFVKDLVALLKARGCFSADSDQYGGPAVIQAAQRALKSMGWLLDATGDLYPQQLAGLEGRDLSDALRQYVHRIQRAGDDNALTIGTAKELLEAAARHVMVETTGSYDAKGDFPTTMFRASTSLGTGTPTARMIQDLDADPGRAVEQALTLTALAINRLRNAEGTGHGRPQPSRASRRQGIIASHAAAAIAFVLLYEPTD